MKNKLKKQKRRLFAIIAASLFALSMAMFIFFTVIACKTKQDTIFLMLSYKLDDYIGSSVRATESMEEEDRIKHLNQSLNYANPAFNYEYYGYEHIVQVQLYDNKTGELIVESRNTLPISQARWHNCKPDTLGCIDYDDFRNSMTDEQYNKIYEYLSTEPDADGKIYELFCSEYYYDNTDIRPKKVEVYKSTVTGAYYFSKERTDEECIESFELNPTPNEGAEFRTTETPIDNCIDTEFFFGEYAKEDLISQIEGKQAYVYDEYPIGELYYTAPLEFVYYNEDIILVDDEYGSHEYFAVFAQKINLLEFCISEILMIFIYIMVVFIVVDIIISVIMWKTLKKQIEQENKLRTVTNAMAHELKTPLFVIGGFAESLSENINTDKREHYSTLITEQTAEMNRLVSKMLEYSKLDSASFTLKKEKISLNEIVKQVVENYDFSEIELECDDEIFINADKALIKTAVENLVENAVKYSDGSGKITVTCQKGKLAVSNPYKEVSAEEIKNMWEPYHRNADESDKQGHGIGLAMVKSIVDLHGMKCRAEYSNNRITFILDF